MSPDKKGFSIHSLRDVFSGLRRREPALSEAEKEFRREKLLEKYPLTNADLWIALAVRKQRNILRKAEDLADEQKFLSASLRPQDVSIIVNNLVGSFYTNIISVANLLDSVPINTQKRPFFSKVAFNYVDELTSGSSQEKTERITDKVEEELQLYKQEHPLTIAPYQIFNMLTDKPERVWVVSARTISDFEHGHKFGLINEFASDAINLLDSNEIVQSVRNQNSKPQIVRILY